jgi:hypothetical protein
MGVEVRLRTTATDVDATGVELQGAYGVKLRGRLAMLVWAAVHIAFLVGWAIASARSRVGWERCSAGGPASGLIPAAAAR